MTAPLDIRFDPEGRSQTILFVFILMAMVFCAACLVLADSGAAWILTLHKPSFVSYTRLFPSVWTGLYVLLAVAAWRVWCITGLKSLALGLYAAQMVTGLLWFFVLFHLHQLGFALAARLAQLGLILLTTIAFWRIDLVAGLLLALNLLWWSFGAAVNAILWQMNP
jgi:benzodiazapine receptor